METPPFVHQCPLVASDQPQDPARFAFITTYALSDLQLNEIDYDHPSRPEDMDVGRRMIVWVNYDPQTVDAQDRGHGRSYQNLSG
jgi:hypothetical protein